jgi:peptide/nickel transport system permease protein
VSAIAQPIQRARRSTSLALFRSTGVLGMVSVAVIALAAFLALFGRMLAPHDPTLGQLSYSYAGPTSGHPLGFDGDGRDVFSRLLAGARTSMLGPLAVVAISMLVGTVLAVSAAWRRGAYDSAVSSGLNIFFAFPGILLAIVATTVFGVGLLAATLALAVSFTPYVARVLRGAALRERNQPYIAALEIQGASATSICLRHLVPNILPLMVAQATVLFGYAMVDLAAISFLGLGVQPPTPDWGLMVSENQAGLLKNAPLSPVAAGLCVVIVVVAFNVLGLRLQERKDERR